jgi:hypothetical protein
MVSKMQYCGQQPEECLVLKNAVPRMQMDKVLHCSDDVASGLNFVPSVPAPFVRAKFFHHSLCVCVYDKNRIH